MSIRNVLDRNKNYIIKEVKNGKSTRELGKEFDCNPGTIWYFLKDYNIQSKYSRSKNYGKKHEYKDLVIKLFGDGQSVYSISKQIDISNSTVNKWLQEWGYDTSKKFTVDKNKPLLKDRVDEVIQLYQSGLSQGEISKKLGYSNSQICRLLKKHNIKSRPIYKYDVDDTYFDKINHEYKAYILGWLYSDGSIGLEGKIRIALKECDKSILEWMKEQLKYTGPLYYKKARPSSPTPQWELCINRKKMADRIIELGCMPSKSMILKFPHDNIIPDEFLVDFIRGYFDGDGSVAKNYMSIVGTLDFINVLETKLPCNITNVYPRYRDRDPKDTSHQLFVCRQEECKKLAHWLYDDATIYLKRKHDIAKEHFLK